MFGDDEDASQLLNPASPAALAPHIRNGTPFEALPTAARLALATPGAYEALARRFCTERALPYAGSLARALFPSATRYATAVVRAARASRMVFPYQMAREILAATGVTPFTYYRSLLIDVVRAELAYDVVPNFTAADALRLLGIGRTEFIHLFNAVRGKGWLARRRRGAVRESVERR
jgi:hypothetical protein